MNYDCKTNWNDVVLPLLSMPSIKKSIKKGITKFINDGQSDELYDSKKCPASYSSNDSWYTHLEDFKEKLTNTLTETGFLKQPPIIDDDIEFDECLECLQYEKYKDEALEPFIKHHEKTSLRAYQLFGACHWWNPTFSLALAKLIYPNEKWNILRGNCHTTIVNKDATLVFDILYFDELDVSLGGSNAIEQARK